MMSWSVIVEGRLYQISARSGSVVIDGEKTKLKNFSSGREGLYRVYQVPVGGRLAQLYVNTWIGGMKLAMEGVDCATGEPFTPPEFPRWAYVFLVIHGINFINGVLGALLAIAGVMATISISGNTKLAVPVRVALNIAMVAVCAMVVFTVAFALSENW